MKLQLHWRSIHPGAYHPTSAAGHTPSSGSTAATVAHANLFSHTPAPAPKRSGRISGLLSRKDRLNSSGTVAGAPSFAPHPARGSLSSDQHIDERISTPASSLASISHHSPSTPAPSTQSVLDVSDEPECPICLEPLSLRLYGERPHVVPQCGHAMHHECFVAMFGDLKAILAAQEREERPGAFSRSSHDGMVCQICRKHLSFGGERIGPKTAAMMGAALGLGRASVSSIDSRSLSDPNGDDKADSARGPGPMVHPLLEAMSERSPIYRKEPGSDGTQRLNVLLTVSVPGRRPLSQFGLRGRTLLPRDGRRSRSIRSKSASSSARRRTVAALAEAPPESQGKKFQGLPEESSGASLPSLRGESLRAEVTADLNDRMLDWKGHQLEHFGGLQYFDILSVVQGKTVRQFGVYLLEEALLCTLEDKRKHVSRYLSVPCSNHSDDSGSKLIRSAPSALKLKGRIYLRHIRAVANSSSADEAALSIKMVDETLPDFVLIVHSERQAELWKTRIEALIYNNTHFEAKIPLPLDMDLSGRTEEVCSPRSDLSTTVMQQQPVPEDEMVSPSSSARMSGESARVSKILTPRSPTTARPAPISSPKGALPPIPCKVDALDRFGHDGSDALPGERVPKLYPLVGIDLIVVVSIPPMPREGATPSNTIKLALLRSSLLFLLDNVGNKSRICLVAYRNGHVHHDGFVAKTRLLRPSSPSSRDTLLEFLQLLAQAHDASSMGHFVEDLTQFPGMDELVDMASGINAGVDVLLQRVSKNPLSALLVVDDSTNGPKRGPMDRLCSRTEATGAGVHTFGLGATHDPSSLWLLASNTRGSYTYLRRASELRIVLAGCVGALLGAALTDVILRIQINAHPSITARKPKSSSSYMVSTDGKTVEVPIGTLHYGCQRDILLEFELDFEGLYRSMVPPQNPGNVDEYLLQFGMDPALLVTPEAEDVPLFKADAVYRDPRMQQQANHLSQPLDFFIKLFPGKDPQAELSPAQMAAVVQAPVTRRTMELLASSLITNSLLVAPHNSQQATALLLQSRQMIEAVLRSTPGFSGLLPSQSSYAARIQSLPSVSCSPVPRHVPVQPEHAGTISSLTGILEDLETLLGVLEGSCTSGRSLSGPERFEQEGRKFAAQQATVLRTQRAWSSRTNTEHLNFKDDNGPALAVLAGLSAPAAPPHRGIRGASS